MLSAACSSRSVVGLGQRHTCRHSLSASNGTAAKLYMKSSQTYHLEIVVGEDEAPENALKRFRWATKSSGLVNEARRRRYFENKQDEIKRRVRDGHMKKSKRYVPPPTYEDAVTTMEPAPFADLFGDSEDIFGQQRRILLCQQLQHSASLLPVMMDYDPEEHTRTVLWGGPLSDARTVVRFMEYM